MTKPLHEVGLVTFGAGNVASVDHALHRLGVDVHRVTSANHTANCRRLILPGVGAFPVFMHLLRELGFDDAIRVHVEKGKPFLGICVGMQVLADVGEEHTDTPGLALIPGRVRKLSPIRDEPVPHMGWNDTVARRSFALIGHASAATMYYAHSFALHADQETDIAASCDYAGGFTAAVQRNNIYGVQFHPEKSQHDGLALLQRFCHIAA